MKDKTTAALLALFLGWLGIHRFYLRQPGLGILYFFLFFVGFISIVLGIIDAIVLLAMEQEEFDRRYNEEGKGSGQYDRYQRRRSVRRDYQRRDYRNMQRRPVKSRRTNVHVPERSRPNPHLQSGIKKYKDFELEEAIKDFQAGLEISPRNIALHFNIACAYSLTEQADKAMYHIDKAIEFGFTDIDKIRTHDDLAFMRIQPEFDEFAAADFRLRDMRSDQTEQTDPESAEETSAEAKSEPPDDKLLDQLKRLSELRDRGLITEQEFTREKAKLMR
jgi:TM2 domain-containing membrane protein YozV